MHAIAWAANASFSSIRSIWSMVRPARCSAFRVAGMGPSPMHEGSTPATAVATMRASGFSPSGCPTTSSAAAPSLIPLADAAVTVPSLRKAGLSLPTETIVAPARGYSSAAKAVPSGPGTATISSLNTRCCNARSARCWLCTANASCSSRVMPYRSATTSAVSPSEIVHSGLNRGLVNRHPTVVSATSGAFRFHASPALSITYGARVMFSTPPAMNVVPSPALIACAALATACSPEPQSRFTVCPGTATGSPASNSAIRATLRLSSPAWLVQPRITSSTPAGSIPERSTTALMGIAARSSARTPASAPPCLPTGVRRA